MSNSAQSDGIGEKPVEHVVIVGGGTAGWLTAGILAADHCAGAAHGLKITVIESPSIPIIGVGEGTWPSIRDSLRRIGVSETDFIRRCNASFKQGSRFNGWLTGADDDFYYHPFDAPPSTDDIDSLTMWRVDAARRPFAQAVCTQAELCLQGRAPKQAATPEFAAVANYAYHLDAPAFAELLREHCTQKLGVRLVRDDVVSVARGDGGVDHLVTKQSGTIGGDLYVDCTGSKALMIGEALGVGLKDVSNVLVNDRALAIHVPYADAGQPIASQTNGTALSAGWVWDIALQNRRGVGYVFSSRFADETAARRELDAYIDRTAPESGVRAEDARLINFSSAYRETPWTGNVVAVGMSQGFVEPLEASAIVMIELSAAMISDIMPANTAMLGVAADRFNKRFAYRWERIVDFLKLHYILSRREEPYWRAHRDRESWPSRLAALMVRWRYEPPSREDFTDALEIFPAASYAFVLYGMQFETEARSTLRRKDNPARAAAHLQHIAARTEKFLGGLPSNRELLDHVLSEGFVRPQPGRSAS